MQKSLIIIAHPKKKSFSFAMLEAYVENLKGKNLPYEIIDLYREENQQKFFTFHDPNELEVSKEMRYFQEKIKNANELVFIYPYWWGGMPAILKNFLDWNLSKGFAFRYENSRPKGLLTDKKVRILTTTGAPNWLYTINGAKIRLKRKWKQQIISFCGMKMESVHIFGGIDTRGKDLDTILSTIKNL